MTHDPQSRVESFNALVRGACVLLLLAGFVFVFIFDAIAGNQARLIDAATYVGVLTLALTWWFKSRDEKAAQEKRDEAPKHEP